MEWQCQRFVSNDRNTYEESDTYSRVWGRDARILDMHSSEKPMAENKTHIHMIRYISVTHAAFNVSGLISIWCFFFLSFTVRLHVRSHSNRKAEEPFLICFFSIFHQRCVPVVRERDLIKIDRNCADTRCRMCMPITRIRAGHGQMLLVINSVRVCVRSRSILHKRQTRAVFEFVGNWIYFIIAWRWFEGMRIEMRTGERKKNGFMNIIRRLLSTPHHCCIRLVCVCLRWSVVIIFLFFPFFNLISGNECVSSHGGQ